MVLTASKLLKVPELAQNKLERFFSKILNNIAFFNPISEA